MRHRPYSSTALILLSGLLLSAIALFLSDPVCDHFQRERLSTHGHDHATSVAMNLQAKLKVVTQYAIELESKDQVSPDEFYATAAKITEDPGIFSVEWAPRVEVEEREQAEAEMSVISGRPVKVMTYEHGRTVVVPKDRPTRPISLVSPPAENLLKQIGFQRGNWAAYGYANRFRQTPFITPVNRWYDNDDARLAVFVSGAIPKPDDQIADDLEPTNTVFATFESVFDQSTLTSLHTTVDPIDLTTAKYEVNSPEGKQDRTLHTVSSTPHEFIARQQIGGRLFEFRVSENANAHLRPIWIPWAAFFACNALTCVIGLNWFRRESVRLDESNQRLQREIETRLATQRHLRSMLDFRDQERELVAHDIHDGFVQDIIGAQMFMESILPLIPEDSTTLQERAETVAGLLGNAIEEARRTIDYLKPKVVDEVGLIAAIESSVFEDLKRYEFETKLFCPVDFPRLPLLVERMLYRIVREALCNARQHSGGDSASLCITFDDENILLEIGDSGKGFDPDQIDSDCFGLSGIRHRAEVLQGEASITTSEYGTMVRVSVSRNSEAPAAITNQSLLIDA